MAKPIEYDAEFPTTAEPEHIFDAASEWAVHNGFTLAVSSTVSARFERGEGSASLWSFDIGRYPTAIVVRSRKGEPVQVTLSLDTGWAVLISAGERNKTKRLFDSFVRALEMTASSA